MELDNNTILLLVALAVLAYFFFFSSKEHLTADDTKKTLAMLIKKHFNDSVTFEQYNQVLSQYKNTSANLVKQETFTALQGLFKSGMLNEDAIIGQMNDI